MAVFRAALCNEIEKLYRKKKVMAAVIISFAVIIIGQILVVGMRTGFGIRGVGSAEFPLLVLSLMINTILPLFTALVAIDCFSSEFSGNTIRISLTRPVSRLKIFTAKVTAITAFIIGNLLILFILSSLAGFLFNSNSATITGFIKVVLSYLVSFVPLMVLALAVVFLTNIFKSGTTVFFAAILGYIIFKAAGVFFPQFSGLLLTTYLSWFNLWLASIFPLTKIISQLIIMLGYAIMFFTAGYYLFDKKEF